MSARLVLVGRSGQEAVVWSGSIAASLSVSTVLKTQNRRWALPLSWRGLVAAWLTLLAVVDRPRVFRPNSVRWRAIEIARLPVVVNCPTIVQLLDYEDTTVDLHGFGDNYDCVTAAWEWGDRVLIDELVEGEYEATELAADVEAGVGQALACLHAEGLVHSDVAPNNIVRVGDVWKLADLDNTVREGDQITGVPRPAYLLDGMDVGKRRPGGRWMTTRCGLSSTRPTRDPESRTPARHALSETTAVASTVDEPSPPSPPSSDR